MKENTGEARIGEIYNGREIIGYNRKWYQYIIKCLECGKITTQSIGNIKVRSCMCVSRLNLRKHKIGEVMFNREIIGYKKGRYIMKCCKCGRITNKINEDMHTQCMCSISMARNKGISTDIGDIIGCRKIVGYNRNYSYIAECLVCGYQKKGPACIFRKNSCKLCERKHKMKYKIGEVVGVNRVIDISPGEESPYHTECIYCGKQKKRNATTMLSGCICSFEEQSKRIVGKKIYSVTVLEYLPKAGGSYYKCRCDCGKIFIRRSQNIKEGKTCGCGINKKKILLYK